MPGHDPATPPDPTGATDPRLPAPASERRPVPRSSSTDALARGLIGAPFLAASAAGAAGAAAAAAAATGAALAARLFWPWAAWQHLAQPGEQPRSPSSWLGPGVHVSYTHVEMHWPLER
jgi:hypothetical protein